MITAYRAWSTRRRRSNNDGKNDPVRSFGIRSSSVGAGPPQGHGRHRYIFAVLALAAGKIEIDPEATPALLMFNLFSGTLGRAFLEGWYER